MKISVIKIWTNFQRIRNSLPQDRRGNLSYTVIVLRREKYCIRENMIYTIIKIRQTGNTDEKVFGIKHW